jgi:hypothetical protein
MDPKDQAPGKTPNGLRPSTEGNAEIPSEAIDPKIAGPQKTIRTAKASESQPRTTKDIGQSPFGLDLPRFDLLSDLGACFLVLL